MCVCERDELEKYIKAGRNEGRGAAVPSSLNLDVFWALGSLMMWHYLIGCVSMWSKSRQAEGSDLREECGGGETARECESSPVKVKLDSSSIFYRDHNIIRRDLQFQSYFMFSFLNKI